MTVRHNCSMFAVCALLFVLPDVAFSQDSAQETQKKDGGTEWSFDARVRPRAEFRSGRNFGLSLLDLRTRAPGSGDLLTLQSRLGVRVKSGALTGRLLLQHVAVWGSTGGGALSQPPLSMAHAYATYAASDAVDISFGRQTLSYGDERVLGAVGWAQQTRSWDGVKVEVKPTAGVKADVFVARSTDGLSSGGSLKPSQTFDQDGFLIGAYAMFTEFAKPVFDEVDVYVLGDVLLEDLSNDLNNPRELLTAGARAKGAWSMVDLTVEGAYQLGSRCQTDALNLACTNKSNDVSAFFADVELGATVTKDPKVRLFVGGSIASGDDPDTDTIESYAHLYPTAHKFLGLTDVVGPRSNVIEGRGGALAKFGNFKIKESVHYFQRVQPESEMLGLEFDTTLAYKIDKGFSVQAGHGIFIPGQAVSATTNAKPSQNHHWMFLQAVGSWK